MGKTSAKTTSKRASKCNPDADRLALDYAVKSQKAKSSVKDKQLNAEESNNGDNNECEDISFLEDSVTEISTSCSLSVLSKDSQPLDSTTQQHRNSNGVCTLTSTASQTSLQSLFRSTISTAASLHSNSIVTSCTNSHENTNLSSTTGSKPESLSFSVPIKNSSFDSISTMSITTLISCSPQSSYIQVSSPYHTSKYLNSAFFSQKDLNSTLLSEEYKAHCTPCYDSTANLKRRSQIPFQSSHPSQSVTSSVSYSALNSIEPNPTFLQPQIPSISYASMNKNSKTFQISSQAMQSKVDGFTTHESNDVSYDFCAASQIIPKTKACLMSTPTIISQSKPSPQPWLSHKGASIHSQLSNCIYQSKLGSKNKRSKSVCDEKSTITTRHSSDSSTSANSL